MLWADVEVCEGGLGLVAPRGLGGGRGGQGVPRLGQEAVGLVATRARPQAAVAQQEVQPAGAEVRQPPGQVGRLHELPRVLGREGGDTPGLAQNHQVSRKACVQKDAGIPLLLQGGLGSDT